jgi:hypothetical protein
VSVFLNCGHSFPGVPGEWQIRDRVICEPCFDNGSPYKRYVVRIRGHDLSDHTVTRERAGGGRYCIPCANYRASKAYKAERVAS